MKTIELHRHSIKSAPGNSNLCQQGIELAENVGAKILRGRNFTEFYISSLQRTADTLAAFAAGAGDFIDAKPQLFLENPDSFWSIEAQELWNGVVHEAELAGEDMMLAALEHDTVRARKVTADAVGEFRTWLAALTDGANVLVVHHSPCLELIAYGLFGVILPQLQPCDGFRIHVDGEHLTLTSVLDDATLDASSL